MRQPTTSRRFGATLLVASLAAIPVLADYPAAVLSDSPLAYYRFNDSTDRPVNAANAGSLGTSGVGTNFNVQTSVGVLAGTRDRAAYFDGRGARSIVPFQAANNPPAAQSFTIEAWVQPSEEVTDAPGPAPLMNRFSYPGVNRQGWVFFQRSPETGWNFRTYTGEGSATGVNITGQSTRPGSGKAGTWNHLVAVWDGAAGSASLYVNGEKVAEGAGGYLANTGDHDETTAPNGPAGLGVGTYNNTDPGANPFRGAIDEVALYAKALTAEQILAHYENALNANRTVAYQDLVLSQAPVSYLRFEEPAAAGDIAVNRGLLGAEGNGINSAGVRHPVPGPLAGTTDTATAYQARNSGGGVQTLVPWSAGVNPESTAPFTIEAWVQPHVEVTDAPGPAPLMNRYSYPGANRQGWVFFQRSPTTGWNFRTFTGEGSATGVNITGQASNEGAGTAGSWNHLVVTWDGENTLASLYVNGEKVAEGSGGYQHNTNDHDPAEAVNGPAGLAIGSYNNTQPWENPFDGAVAEVALYHAILTEEQIKAHYDNGTNALRTAAYPTVVAADRPQLHLRLNDPAYYPANNSGTLGLAADGSLVGTSPGQAGPRPPAFAGFEADNRAVALEGTNSFVTLNNPAGLNFTGQITLSAWVQPAAAQGTPAYVIAHGPDNANLGAVSLRLVDGTTYAVGTFDGTDHDATAAIPAEDLSGTAWVHLVGTYDGARWNLYRNGALLASTTDPVGAAQVPADWAIGQRARGKGQAFAGAVDEVAIYNKALSAARVQAHYQAATSSGARPTVAIARGDAQVQVTWTGSALEQAESVTGPYSAVAGATSPYSAPVSGAPKFYRSRQ